MRALASVVALVACSGCAAIAGVNEYDPFDCVGTECAPAHDTAAAENALPESDTMTTDTSVATDSATDTAPACTPIAATTVTIGTWAIDATEVTNGQYAAFLAAKGADISGQASECLWNASYRPSLGWPPPIEQCNHPVVRVDWCDAYAYCKWAGKRLCGSPSGGSASFSGYATISTSQWYAACSRASGSKYLYGATYVAGACVDDAYDGKSGIATTDVKRRVASAANCRGPAAPYNALFDMNGNVAEWEDSCADSEGTGDDCRIRGGSYLEGWDKCDCDEAQSKKRAQTADDVGFRCCSL